MTPVYPESASQMDFILQENQYKPLFFEHPFQLGNIQSVQLH